jgi:hypothetical protein
MKNSSFRFPIFPIILLLCLVFSCEQQAKEAKVETKADAPMELDKIPTVVMAALKAKFPDAEIHKWTREEEGDITVYDIEFKQKDRKFEADIKEDGSIHNWEKEIAATDLPEAVKTAVEERYVKSTHEEIMEITAVKDGQDVLEGYEIVLKTAEGEEVEVTVAPDGEIVEESTEEE